jgi:pyruvate/2-oxoglutarate dehydrogenase complex dihydrolipoamide dehydrogenase (E3) component
VYDLVIVGAGSAGLTAADFAARLGVRVALVERDRIGGDCTWTGCVPSKALVRVARMAHQVRTAGDYGIRACGPVTDMPSVRDYVRNAIARVYRSTTPEELGKKGIDVLAGAHASLLRTP